MDIPSLFMIPSAVSSGKVHSVFPNSTDADFDFARSSTASRVNSDGLIETVASGQARLNYEIEGGLVNTKPSLLLEPQSTNLITYSEDFSQSYWEKSDINIIANSSVSPNGTVNGYSFTRDASTGSSFIRKQISTATGVVSLSIFAKYNGRQFLQLSSGVNYANFDLLNGIITVSSSTDSSIENYGNGWYRLIININLAATLNYYYIWNIDSANSDRVESSTGNGTDGIYIYGAMLEQLSYSTSYIPTNGSTQTRAAETCNGAGTSSIFESSEGILYAEIAALANDATYRELGISNGSTTNRVLISYTSTNNYIRFQVRSSDTTSATIYSTGQYNVTEYLKIAARYKTNNFELYVNGTSIGTDTSGASPVALQELAFDNGSGGDDFYGKIRDIRVYNTKEMTDSEVDILLTKITS